MTAWICATCGNHQPDTDQAPIVCAICADERQWVPPSGQRWTSASELAAAGHRSDVREVEPNLIGVGASPPVAIGQRALVVRTRAGNVLWDPPGYVDEAGFAALREAGGLLAVTASHPHFYASIVDWATTFGAEILLPEPDVRWLLRRDTNARLRTWTDRLEVVPGVTLVQCGGHFAGSAVLHWAEGAEGGGVLLTGDTIFVTPGEDRVTFVRSAPNRLPLPEAAVRRIVEAVRPFAFERIYGGWWEPIVRRDAKRIVEASAARYIAWLRGELPLD